jgi:hypothetical protein
MVMVVMMVLIIFLIPAWKACASRGYPLATVIVLMASIDAAFEGTYVPVTRCSGLTRGISLHAACSVKCPSLAPTNLTRHRSPVSAWSSNRFGEVEKRGNATAS